MKVGTTPSKRRDKLNVNPVISQAKLTVMKNEASKYSNHQKNKTKLILQDIRQNKKEKSNSQKELFQYFDSTKDPILDSYFVLEKRKEEGEK